ncbi:uncharacterized protein [Halyomorpha halys]|nr:probable 4-coumarate--CoA ligase 1 isoform X2 [Halyomorpha halys]
MAITASNRLKSAGIEPGCVVGICARNCLEYIGVLLGIWNVGATAVLLSTSLRPRELHHLISLVKPVAIYAPDINAEQEDVFESLPKTRLFQWPLGELLKDERPLDQENSSRNEFNNMALLLSSSGTTGIPKLVAINHSSVVTSVEKLRTLLMLDNETALGLIPFSHAYGIGLLLMALCQGTTLIVLEKYVPERFSDIFATYEITHLHTVPTFLVKLIDGSTDIQMFKSLRYIFTSSCPADPKLQAQILNTLTNVKMYHMFGMTETTHIVTYERVNLNRTGSIGRILPFTKAKVIGTRGEKVEKGLEGELCLSGPTIMAGYYSNKAATEEAFTQDGWLRTGDLARIDSEGYIYIIDRIKNLIKFHGQQVSPSEIEQVITEINGVSEAAVVGVPDEKYGEVPRAYVVKKDNTVTERDIEEVVERELAYYKWLRGGVRFVESLPKTPLFKVIKKDLLSIP